MRPHHISLTPSNDWFNTESRKILPSCFGHSTDSAIAAVWLIPRWDNGHFHAIITVWGGLSFVNDVDVKEDIKPKDCVPRVMCAFARSRREKIG